MCSFKRTAFVIHCISYVLTLTWALEVAPNSACASLCMDRPDGDPSNTKSSSTQTRDLFCEDWQYGGTNATSAGRKWKSCIECESSSNRFDQTSGENDVYWFLFNIKFNVDWCIFGYPDNPNTTAASNTCGDACDSLKYMTTSQLLHTDMSLQYAYCALNNETFQANVGNCTQCLAGLSGAQTLRNYLNAMAEGCQQRPGNGTALKLDFNVFSTISTSSTIATSTSTALSSSTTTASATVSAATSSQPPNNSSGIKIGVGVGVSIGVLLVALVVGVLVFRSHRKTRAKGELNGWNDQRSETHGVSRGRVEMSNGLNPSPGTYKHMAEMSSGVDNNLGPYKGVAELSNATDPKSTAHRSVAEIGPTTPRHGGRAWQAQQNVGSGVRF